MIIIKKIEFFYFFFKSNLFLNKLLAMTDNKNREKTYLYKKEIEEKGLKDLKSKDCLKDLNNLPNQTNTDDKKSNQIKEEEIYTCTCWGCLEDQPNQLAHMDPGGCLYQSDSDLED